MKLDTNLPRAIDLQETRRPVTVKPHFGIGSIVANNNVIFMSKLHHLGKLRLFGHGRGRIIGIIYPKELGLTSDRFGYSVEVREEAILLCQREKIIFAPGKQGTDVISRVARRRN